MEQHRRRGRKSIMDRGWAMCNKILLLDMTLQNKTKWKESAVPYMVVHSDKDWGTNVWLDSHNRTRGNRIVYIIFCFPAE